MSNGGEILEGDAVKVRTCKNIDIEVDVEIDMHDFLAECADRADECNGEYWRQIIPALDGLTRILANVKDETIAAMPEAARETLCERLITQAARYDSAP